MSANRKTIRTQFAPETGFETRPAVVAPFRAVLETEFERLKIQLLRRRLETITEPGHNSQVRSAANEAAALAWVTPFPLLVFPELFEEKAKAVEARAAKQQEILERME